MGVRSKVFAFTYDRQLARAEAAGLGELRQRLLASVAGRVLEIGAGTGANLRYYGDGIDELVLTEPEPPMLRRLERGVADRSFPIAVLRAPAEDLPFDDDTFDVVISTLVLCGVDDQPRALRQLRRVLLPGGQLLFIEHVRSDDPQLARRQDRMNPLNRFVACCDCNRPTLESIQAGGFTIADIEHRAFPKAPSFVRPLIVGRATAPPTAVDTDAHLAHGRVS
jgi:ubiquinone/menaquinone biosynthesis C-methylase UbiE